MCRELYVRWGFTFLTSSMQLGTTLFGMKKRGSGKESTVQVSGLAWVKNSLLSYKEYDLCVEKQQQNSKYRRVPMLEEHRAKFSFGKCLRKLCLCGNEKQKKKRAATRTNKCWHGRFLLFIWFFVKRGFWERKIRAWRLWVGRNVRKKSTRWKRKERKNASKACSTSLCCMHIYICICLRA